MVPPRLLAGVDVGGAKIAAGLVDSEGSVVVSLRTRTAPDGGAAVVRQIIDLLHQVLTRASTAADSVVAVGVAVPAVVDRGRGTVLWAPNIAGWQTSVELAGPVQEAVGIPASLHYDGHAWVAGEWWRGAARGTSDVALIAVGTGIGGGLILGGRLHRGQVGVAGAVGWWATQWEGGSAHGPETGECLESVASGPAIARAAGRDGAEEAFRAAREGDRRAGEAVERAAGALGAAVASLASLVDPELVVLAGGVIVGGADLLLPRIREVVSHSAQPQIAQRVRIETAELGEDAGWMGAAWLAARELDEKEECS